MGFIRHGIKESGMVNFAENVIFDKTGTTLNSTNTQGAIEELDDKAEQINADLSACFGKVNYDCRQYTSWQDALSANVNTFMPTNGHYIFSFSITGGVPFLCVMYRSYNEIFGLVARQGYPMSVLSTDSGANWTWYTP